MSEPKVITIDNKKHWKDTDLGPRREGKWFCVTRYGGVGDVIQAASVFPAMKKLGFKIAFNTQHRGYNVIKGNPYVDEYILQEVDQIKPTELGEFWQKLASLYSRYTNFSETVEKTLLASDTVMMWAWPQQARHMICNVNYFELMFAVATIPFKAYETYQPFYPTPEEDAWAKEQRKAMGNKAKVVVWALSGSAHHKVSPWADASIIRLLLSDPTIHVVTVGDEACKILEGRSWDNESRVHTWAGQDIRKTLAFLKYADVVIGPETGVINAAGVMPDVHSILMCSHSNPNKVSKYFVNHTDLEPEGLNCYPCHLLHNKGPENCFRVDLREIMEGGNQIEKPLMTAACTVAIDDDMIVNAVMKALRQKELINEA